MPPAAIPRLLFKRQTGPLAARDRLLLVIGLSLASWMAIGFTVAHFATQRPASTCRMSSQLRDCRFGAKAPPAIGR